MKILLTGASGFVGSHILDNLVRRGLPAVLLLRPTSDRTFLQSHVGRVELREGSVTNPETLRTALKDITHVIHCAGCTKAVRSAEFFRVNHLGTRNLVEAVNGTPGIRRVVHVSSLAAAGPGTLTSPAREDQEPAPVSEYGRSKLAGEAEVRRDCKTEFVVLRPPAVYGPRDTGFLSLFRAVARHILPLTTERQTISIVYVEDLAEIVVRSLDHPGAAGKTWFVASPETVTGRSLGREIARQMNRWVVPVPLPVPLFWPICLGQEIISRLTNRPNLLNLAKYPELAAPGWVCDTTKLERELGTACRTGLAQGVSTTLKWYRQEKWI